MDVPLPFTTHVVHCAPITVEVMKEVMVVLVIKSPQFEHGGPVIVMGAVMIVEVTIEVEVDCVIV